MAVDEGEKSQSSLLAKETAVVEPATEPTGRGKASYRSHRILCSAKHISEKENPEHDISVERRRSWWKSKLRVLHTSRLNLFRVRCPCMCEVAIAETLDERERVLAFMQLCSGDAC
jgi:hypothetical protein